jgi:NitT/TauT family transport system substrate-binding protein
MGRAHIGYADMSALLRAKVQSKINVTALMSVMNKAPHAFFFLASSKINNITDIQGKRVATSPFTSSHVFLPLLLDINHIPKDSIRLIKADPGALGPMLATGNTDIVISWLTDKVKYQSQVASLGKELQSLPWYDAGLEFYATTLIANDRFLSKQPDLAKRFVKAFKQAMSLHGSTRKKPHKRLISKYLR